MGFAEAFLIVVAVLFGPVVVVVRVVAWLRRRRRVLVPVASLVGAGRAFRWPRVRVVDFLAAMSLGLVAWGLWVFWAYLHSGSRC